MNVLLVLQILSFISSVTVFWATESILNQMTQATAFWIRTSFHLLATGAIGSFLWICAGNVPDWPQVVLLTGITLYMLCERRTRSGWV